MGGVIRNVFGEEVAYNPTLAICLPVYKRPQLLARALASIVTTAKPFDVPIFIADDSCDDTNRAVIEETCRLYPLVAWHRNATNLGIDRNVLRSIELSPCRYTWPSGEDDLMRPEAVQAVMGVLAAGDFAFVFANYAYTSNDYERVSRSPAIDLTEDREFAPAEFLARFGWATGFLGSCVIDMRWWHSIDKARYVGTFFAHVGSIYEGIHGRRMYAVARPLVLNRAENAASFTWANDAVKVVYGWKRLLALLEPLYGPEVIRQADRASRGNFKSHSLLWLLSRRADGAFNLHEWRTYVRSGSDGPFFRICALLVSLFPRQVLAPLKRILRP